MVIKPAVTNKPPIIVSAGGTISTSRKEILAIHYVNTTAGKGQVTIHDGGGNTGITLGSDAQGGNDSFEPVQPFPLDRIIVTFDTGTGIVTILYN